MKNNIGKLRILVYFAVALFIVSCSTTSKLEEDEVLYTGVKKFNIETADGNPINEDVKTQLATVINVKPNNSLISPYIRSPFPIGLWVYNHWSDSCKGLKGWLYNKLVEQPVLITDVRPDMRLSMLRKVMDNNGYFGSTASYDLLYDKKNPKKARINYTVRATKPYEISSIEYFKPTTKVTEMIDSMLQNNNYLKVGNRFSLDSLNQVRIDVANNLRNRGYFYFRPDYIEYLADSTIEQGKIALRLNFSSNVPDAALRVFRTGNITTRVNRARTTTSVGRSSLTGENMTIDTALIRNRMRANIDTFDLKRKGKLIKAKSAHVNPNMIASNIRFTQGRTFSVRNMDATQNNLSRTGVFSGIMIDVTPIDSITPDRDSINVLINCTLDQPIEAKIEGKLKSKSNSFIGPGLELGLTHKNLFGGGEQLTTTATAAYEWQTGGDSHEKVNRNSYMFGLQADLAIPRLLAPKFVDRSRRYVNWTRFSLSGKILNRPQYFKMGQLGGSISWEWHANRNSLNVFTPFSLKYNKLMSKTEIFEELIEENKALANSFRNQFIPEMKYEYTYDRKINADNNITFSASASEAGNIFAAIWRIAGVKGEKKMFGTPFSQYVKFQTQVVHKHRVFADHWLVSRILVGAAHAYGNSTEMPYSEQFYTGGANSVRAFAVRSIGPGSYVSDQQTANGYYDQTGTFKVELNAEYRFTILGYLKGAVFVDAGNVWLLKDDEDRPGGKLQMKNFFKELALGTGIGLRFDMDMLVIRGDLGIGIHAPYYTGKSGYYNMISFKDSLAFHIAIGYPF